MKYLEQRVEYLEKQVQELKVKLFQKEFEENKNSWKETPYPNIWSSWDDILDYIDSSDLPAYYPPANPEDVIGHESKMTCPKQPIILRRLSHDEK